MLELQQEGFLERMTEKWFRSRSVCGAETQAAQEADEEGGDQLHFSDMAGGPDLCIVQRHEIYRCSGNW